MSQLGQNLPASIVAIISPGIVQVKFEVTNLPYTLPQVICPIEGSEFIRIPIAPKMLGWVKAASVSLGGVSGQGGGTANGALPEANLSAVVWSPVGNVAWSPTDDIEAVLIYGPNGVVIRDKASNCKIVLTKTGIDVFTPAGIPTIVHGPLAVVGDLLLGGQVRAQNGGIYQGNVIAGGRIVAGAGGADAVDVQTHTHQYNRPASGTVTPANTNSPNPVL